ncbi:Putative 115 kDa protein in type-1 retrotransposable element R1DM [Eumeta japonica]|uniref:115 kDa protein in type-1 retrotransposable element R1DM n=3 Tax=Eumeta variegata TaxID=151549 RepID=A0A4C2ABU1_EUMVA|nr:Putative 115 kDa protein in type-1 retrotransposable element R1DM [Eumeta japonica]
MSKGDRKQKAVLLISLDIEGAFDNAWWPALKHSSSTKMPGNLYQMACSYLTERKITVNYARETVTKSTNKGCVQGSICGPTFWNIIIDSLLQRLTDAKVHCQAFADDVVLAFSSESSSTIENAANEAMKIVTKWGSENKLNFAPQKHKLWC